MSKENYGDDSEVLATMDANSGEERAGMGLMNVVLEGTVGQRRRAEAREKEKNFGGNTCTWFNTCNSSSLPLWIAFNTTNPEAELT